MHVEWRGGGKLKRREEGRGEERERKGGGMEEDVGGRVEGREGLSAQTDCDVCLFF